MASRGATGGAGRAAEGEEDRDRGVGVAKEGEWTVARPPTPFMDEHGVSKGWYELEHMGWVFRSQERPMAGTEELSTIRADLGLERSVPLPDMVFPHNYLELIRPDVGIRLVFTPQDALHSWNEQQHELSLSEDGTLDATNFDWTYGHDFRGRIDIDRAVLRTMLRTHKLIEAPYFGHPVRASIRIPDDRLRETGHIHYYSSIDLWQDELADRGVATLKVKIRVMKDLFLVLLRTFLRVDGKHVRMVDVRWFHDFAEAFMLRETSVRVATLEELRKASEGSRPFSASVSDKAQRDERFFFQEEQVYELIKPKSVTTEIVALSVGGT